MCWPAVVERHCRSTPVNRDNGDREVRISSKVGGNMSEPCKEGCLFPARPASVGLPWPRDLTPQTLNIPPAYKSGNVPRGISLLCVFCVYFRKLSFCSNTCRISFSNLSDDTSYNLTNGMGHMSPCGGRWNGMPASAVEVETKLPRVLDSWSLLYRVSLVKPSILHPSLLAA